MENNVSCLNTEGKRERSVCGRKQAEVNCSIYVGSTISSRYVIRSRMRRTSSHIRRLSHHQLRARHGTVADELDAVHGHVGQ